MCGGGGVEGWSSGWLLPVLLSAALGQPFTSRLFSNLLGLPCPPSIQPLPQVPCPLSPNSPNSLRAPKTSFLEPVQARWVTHCPGSACRSLRAPTVCEPRPHTHLKGLVGTDIQPVASLPGPAGSKSVCTLQALPEEVQVEKDVVLATQASFRGQKHQVSEGVRRAADVDNCGAGGGSRREKPRSGGGGPPWVEKLGQSETPWWISGTSVSALAVAAERWRRAGAGGGRGEGAEPPESREPAGAEGGEVASAERAREGAGVWEPRGQVGAGRRPLGRDRTRARKKRRKLSLLRVGPTTGRGGSGPARARANCGRTGGQGIGRARGAEGREERATEQERDTDIGAGRPEEAARESGPAASRRGAAAPGARAARSPRPLRCTNCSSSA